MTEAAEGMDPSVLLPADLTDLDPSWKSCSLLPLGLGRDPPRTLEPASNMLPKATSEQASPTATQRVPHPHSMPKLPSPDPTLSSFSTEATPLSALKDTADDAAAYLQKPSSVCLPNPQSQTYLSTSAESLPAQPISSVFSPPRPNVRPRNEAADTAEMKTAVPPRSGAAYISATSYAAYESAMQAWADGMSSEASVMRVPPVAPSNPYMALPKHRSAKRSHSPTTTGSRFSTQFSETRATSEPEGTSPLEDLPLISATYQSTPNPPLAKAPAHISGALPSQSALPAPPEPDHAENETAGYQPCDQDIVANPGVTTRDAGFDHSPSILMSSDSASLAPLPSQRVSSFDVDEASLPASSYSSIETVGRDRSSTVISQARVSNYASLTESTTGLPTTTASSPSGGGPKIRLAGSGSMWWIALGLMIFAVLS